MKNRIIYIVLGVLLNTVIFGCSEGSWNGEGTPSLEGKYLGVSTNNLYIGSQKGDTSVISISSYGAWTITNIPSWLSVSPTSGSGSSSIVVKVENDNPSSSESRKGSFAVSAGGTSITVNVTQTPSDAKLTVNSTTVSDISKYSATFKSSYTSNADIKECGFCYSTTTQPPTLQSNVVKSATSDGTIFASITDLQSGLTYYVRAYVTNNNGTSYGEAASFTTKGSTPGADDNPTPNFIKKR